MKKLGAYAIAILGSNAFLFQGCGNPSPGVPRTPEETTTVTTGVRDSGASREYASARSLFRHYRSDSIWQTAYWGFAVLGGKGVEIEHHDPGLNTTRSFEYSTSFRVRSVVAAKSDVAQLRETLYVLGETDLGGQVIEQWIHEPQKFQLPGAPITLKLTRSTVHEGTRLGEIQAIQVDPTGSFLVVAHSDPATHLTQIGLAPGFPMTPLLDPSIEAFLASGVSSIYRAEHVVEGLVWIVYLNTDLADATAVNGIVLRDLDSDSILDSWIGYTYNQMKVMYPHRHTKHPWVDDFKSYR